MNVADNWLTDFNGTSTHLGLFYAQRLGNPTQWTQPYQAGTAWDDGPLEPGDSA